MSVDMAGANRAHWIVRRFSSHAEADTREVEYWRQISPGDRAVQVWRLSEEAYRLANLFPDEPRLRRSVERIHRG